MDDIEYCSTSNFPKLITKLTTIGESDEPLAIEMFVYKIDYQN